MSKTREQISFNMKQIKSKNSQIEVILRTALWHRGLRYRKNPSDVYGKPDIVFKKQKIAIFCDGEFWHGFDWKNRKKEFKTNRAFWISKIEHNMQRDEKVNRKLKILGWLVLRFWGEDIKTRLQKCLETIEKAVYNEKTI